MTDALTRRAHLAIAIQDMPLPIRAAHLAAVSAAAGLSGNRNTARRDARHLVTRGLLTPMPGPGNRAYTRPQDHHQGKSMSVTRASAEIFARAQAADDGFGWARGLLLAYCDYETVRPLLTDGVTADDWAKIADNPERVGESARSYHLFALGKIAAKRGISAERSVIKLREYAWLMGRDDVVAAMDAAPYGHYGAPKVAAFGEGFGYAAETGESQ